MFANVCKLIIWKCFQIVKLCEIMWKPMCFISPDWISDNLFQIDSNRFFSCEARISRPPHIFRRNVRGISPKYCGKSQIKKLPKSMQWMNASNKKFWKFLGKYAKLELKSLFNPGKICQKKYESFGIVSFSGGCSCRSYAWREVHEGVLVGESLLCIAGHAAGFVNWWNLILWEFSRALFLFIFNCFHKQYNMHSRPVNVLQLISAVVSSKAFWYSWRQFGADVRFLYLLCVFKQAAIAQWFQYQVSTIVPESNNLFVIPFIDQKNVFVAELINRLLKQKIFTESFTTRRGLSVLFIRRPLPLPFRIL